MCVGDCRFNRFLRTQMTDITATAAAVTIPMSRQRAYVGIFNASAGDTVKVELGQSDGTFFTIANGIINARFLFWNMFEHGMIPTLAFRITAPNNSNHTIVIEQFLPEAMLNAAMEDFINPEVARWPK